MRFRVPTYYKEFKCIAHECKDSCCIGWEIDIDEETYDYYNNVPGEFGERLRSHMKAGSENCFRLKNNRCPFLNQNNLCDICVELGEEALSEVCTEYPRFTMEYGDVIEKCMALSCEEVGRLIFETKGYLEYEEIKIPDSCEVEESEEYQEAMIEENEVDEEEFERIEILELTREKLFEIIRTRSISIEVRMILCLRLSEEIQFLLNESNYEKARVVIHSKRIESEVQWLNENKEKYEDNLDPIKNLEFRNQCFEELEILDDEWKQAFHVMKRALSQKNCTSEQYVRQIKQFMNEERQREYEHILSYFIFRYFMRSVYDYNLLSKVKLAIISVLCIRDLGLVHFQKQNGVFTSYDQIDVARIYSKEVEHSEENIEILLEQCEFEAEYKTFRMISSINVLSNL